MCPRENYVHTPETRAKISAAKKGKPSAAMHNRWHVKRGIVKKYCIFCERAK